MSEIMSMKNCKCGKPARPGANDCAECHSRREKIYRGHRRGLLKILTDVVNSKIIHRDPETFKRFEGWVHTHTVRVITPDPALHYVGIPLGFLPGDDIVVWHDGKTDLVKLNNLRSFGAKRTKI